MKIHDLHIDGFGRWSDLDLSDFDEGLNVIYGPNESGKTTLLQFIRTMLYGFSPQRRQRYLPPASGAEAGGTIVVADENGTYTIDRHDRGDIDGSLRVTGPDGTTVQPRDGDAIAPVDESVFNNVFAIGLGEIQELATLGDEEVAARLYDVAGGVDRVSLAGATRDLQAAREQLLGDGGPQASQLQRLLADRDRLRQETEETKSLNRRYATGAAGRRGIDAEIARLETVVEDTTRRSQVATAAMAICDKWHERAECRRQLEQLPEPPEMPPDAARRLELCKDRIRVRRRALRLFKDRRAKLRAEAAELPVNENWLRHAPHLAALVNQQDWIASLEKRAAVLTEEIDGLQRQIETEDPAQVARRLDQLRPLHEAVRAATQRHERVEQKAAEFERAAASAAREIETVLAELGEKDLSAAIDKASHDVGRLGRPEQLDAEIGKLEQSIAEIDRQSLAAQVQPLLSRPWLIGLGSLFVIGVPLVFAWLVLGGSLSGESAWTLAVVGLTGLATAVVLKVLYGRRDMRPMESWQRQMIALGQQLQGAKHAREQVHAAQRRLARLHELQPSAQRHEAARIKASKARAAAAETAEKHRQAKAVWGAAVREAGLDAGLTLEQVAGLLNNKAKRLSQLQDQLHGRQRELHETQQTRQEFMLRVRRLFGDLGLEPTPLIGESIGSQDSAWDSQDSSHPTGAAVSQLQDLQEELLQQEARLRQRERLRRESGRLRRRMATVCDQGRRWSRRRRWLLQTAGAKDEAEFFSQIERAQRYLALCDQAETLDREIAAYRSDVPWADVEALLEQTDADRLPEERRNLEDQLRQGEEDLLAGYERRGELDGELKRLAQDNSPAERRLELGVAEQRLQEAIGAWQVLAATSYFVDTVRETYQRDRQPDVLKEASHYLAGLTEGRHVRVWTPLEEDALRVETDAGESLPVEVLSRGTREQVFLSLRLALVRSYAERGVELPIVLDDVLVNFDAGRAKAAAKVLRDFARQGHQLFVFTCHEHIAKMFRRLKGVTVRTLGEEAADENQATAEPSPAAA